MVEGHRSHTQRAILSQHTIFQELNEAFGTARSRNFMKLVSTYPVDHYICNACLEDYLGKDQNRLERLYRYRHVLSLLEMVKTQKNFNLYITETCFEVLFTMKLSDREGTNDKLSFSSRAPHSRNRG